MKWLITSIFILWAVRSNAQIEKDKMQHFVAGATISIGMTELVYMKTHNHLESVVVGVGIGCLAGAAKELYDATGRGCPSARDFWATCLGASVSSLTLVIKLD